MKQAKLWGFLCGLLVCFGAWGVVVGGMEFEEKGGALVGLRGGGHQFLEGASPVWGLEAMSGERVGPENAKVFHWEKVDGGIELAWAEFGLESAPGLRVVVRVNGAGAESFWRIRVEGIEDFPLREVRFPRLERVARQAGEELAVPVWMGQLTRRARELFNGNGKGSRREWSYPGLLSMQLTALSGEAGGLLVQCRDAALLRKHFALFGDGAGGLGLEVVHLPEVTAGAATYQTPYDTVLSTFQGDWYTAAEIYRAWALDQSWARESRLRRGLTPDWVLDTGLWVWNRGRSEGVLGPAAALQERLGMPVSVFWHWWHGCAYDAGFPEYFPPREGAERFKAAVAAAAGADVHALVYMNQRLWGMTTASWAEKNAKRYAVKGPDGTVRPEVYNTFMKAPCASMCMGTKFWRDTYAGLAERAVRELGVAGVYMDQACSSLACYDPAHGHPVGGGSYWMAGFRALESDIRERCGNVTLAGEGCGEAWLPHLDLMLSLQVSQERYMRAGEWEPIPFFHAVYHDCGVFYGNYSSLTRPPYDELWPEEFAPEKPLDLLPQTYSRQFRLEQARAFAWGQQPTVANFRPEHFDSRGAEMGYVERLARLRMRAKKYLLHGRFLRPPEIEAPRETFKMSRLSIYAGQHDAVREFEMEAPVLLASAWRAPDGGVGFVVASVAERELEVRLPLDREAYGLAEAGVVYRLEVDGGKEQAAEFAAEDSAAVVTVRPCGAEVFEVSPTGG